MNNPAAEISSYLKHGDYSVAVRRTLDLCLDSGNDAIIEKAIRWSRQYHETENGEAGKALPADFIEEAEKILVDASATGAGNYEQPKPLISAEDISKKYNNSSFSLKPINLSVNTGDVLGVVGENGNGKTTLLRCLAGQLGLNNGVIKYHLLEDPDAYAIKNHIAFIPQRIPK